MNTQKLSSFILIGILLSGSLSLYAPYQNAYATVATGGTITYSGNNTIHTFTTSGTFTVTSAGNVEYLVVGGGAGGSHGGGGAGGFRTASGHAVTIQGYSVTVGAGGSGAVASTANGGGGGSSVFDTITSTGGGGGGAVGETSTFGDNGASGGGGGSWGTGLTTGGTSTAYGNDGGTNDAQNSPPYPSGGGGGAGAIGNDAASGTVSGAGGVGTASSISGSSVTYSGGGGGGLYTTGGSAGAGGVGGGGAGSATTTGGAATVNTGGGGGGTHDSGTGGAGGSGIVIISYVTDTTPHAVDDLTSTSIGATTIDLDWTEPNLNGESLIGYQINYTTPFSQSVRTTGTVFTNDTGTIDMQVTGLSINTPYSFTVSAWTGGGNNATFANVYNATTINPTPTATGLVATASSDSIIGLDWDDSIAADNLTGYRIFSESPTGNGWTLEVNDTGSTTSSYSDTILITKTQYNYMVAGINATGVGTNSTASADYTWGVPDGITGFTIINPTVDSLDPDYTASTSYGYAVTGYETLRDNVFLIYQGNVTTFTDSSLDPVTSYEYSIRALSSFGNSTWVNATGTTVTTPPTSLTVNDGYHTLATQLNLEWIAPVPSTGVNGYKIETESPISGGWSTLVANTTNTLIYYNHTGLANDGVFHNYRIYALTSDGASAVSNTFAYTTHKLPDSVTDLVITTIDELFQFIATFSTPDNLNGSLQGFMINYTTPISNDPQTIYTSTGSSPQIISGLPPAIEHSFRVSAVTNHGSNVTFSNVANQTMIAAVTVGEVDFSVGSNTDAVQIHYELFNVDTSTDVVQVSFLPALGPIDCTVDQRLAGGSTSYTGLAETVDGVNVYHNFTVTNGGNDILDWDCWDSLDTTINAQYSLTQDEASSLFGGVANVPLFQLMGNYTSGLNGTDGTFAGVPLITMLIVIVSMMGFNRTNPALGVGVMTTMLGAAWYYELIEWQSGMLGAIAMVLVLAIGMGLKKRG